ncbi:MAG: biopolymer transporter ExbD [Verrucomicrobia bacterium]|nr:MAG: biopolymer transporter ExbD [Verrucomicrobiota bacterium]PYJ94524.1 MAG: biopolymer transporter ExbD [Verrucomicrobiota bacterium]
MKIGSPLPHKKARIEIIPLIDIMFFLLASFMMASLTMIKLQSIKMDLPTATTASRDFKPDILNVSVDKLGDIYVGTTQLNLVAFQAVLSNRFKVNTNLPVYISGDKDATHGAVIRVLDIVRREGIQKVSFAITPAPADKK